jgi:hypothetical protein
MKYLLLIIGYTLFLISIITTNIYLLGLCELILIPTLIYIVYKNFNKKLTN